MLDLELLLSAAVAAAIAGLVTNLVVPLVARIAVAVKALDYPGERKLHLGPTPRLGGLAITAGLVFGPGAVTLMMWSSWESPMKGGDIFALTLATALVFLSGLVDDLIGVSAWQKLAIQVVAAVLVVRVGWHFSILGIPGAAIELGPFGSILTVVWIVGVTNAINLIDGLDGLATGVVAIIATSFLVYSFVHHSPFTVVLMAGVVGGCLGFLPHNWEPARIFMGDAGSLTLGFLLASLSVFNTLKSPAAVAILVPILALGVPVIDTLLVMLVRFLERPKGPFVHRFLRVVHADTNHLHHLLDSLVTTRRYVVGWIYGMVVVSCGMALIVALTKRSGLGMVLLGVELAAVALVRRLGLARKARLLSARQVGELIRDEAEAGPTP